MKGDSNVIRLLNTLLAEELTAADQYFVHAQMYFNWGYSKLGAHNEHERQEEIGHATRLIERILFLEGTPDMVGRTQLIIGKTVPEMLESDLQLEYRVSKGLREVIAFCESVRDYVTRDILRSLLDDTERDHAHWLEQQLTMINMMGLPNYLQTQI